MSEKKSLDDYPGHTLPASALQGSDVGCPTVWAASAASVTGRTMGFCTTDSIGGNDEL
jgi:hypothetical protein